jgi:hypothetical protein
VRAALQPRSQLERHSTSAMRNRGVPSWRRCASAKASCSRRPARGVAWPSWPSSPARQVTQTWSVTAVSEEVVIVGVASSADWSIAKPVNRWRPLKERLPDKRRADLHSVRPTLTLQDAPPGMAIRQAAAGFLAHGSSPAPPSRVNPSGFWCRLSAHSCGGSSGFAGDPGTSPDLLRPVFPLSPARRRDTVGWGLIQTETPSSQSLRNLSG